ncbi:methyl-accepting chemotaxis protein [Gemmatimonas sp.]
MQWFDNTRLRTKLMIAFSVVLSIVTVQSVIAFRATTANTESSRWTDHTHAVIEAANGALAGLVDMETGYRGFLVTGGNEFLEPYEAGKQRAESGLTKLQALTADNPAQVARWKDLMARATAWQDEITTPGIALRKSVSAGEATQDQVIAFETSGKGKQHFDGMRAVFSDAVQAERTLPEARSADSLRTAQSLLWVIVGGTLTVVLLGVLIAVALAKRIGTPMNELTLAAQALARGDLDVTLTIASHDEIGALAGSFKDMIASQKTMTESAAAIAGGNVAVAVSARSDKDVLGHAFIGLRQTLEGLVTETSSLVAAATAGQLKARGNAERFSGAYRALVDGINQTLDAVVRPIDESSRVLAQIAERDLTARVSGTYAGDFAQIKESINRAAETLDHALGQVSMAADQTASAGQQIASGSQSLAQGSSEQAASLEEVSGSLTEMLSSSTQMAANARDARRMAEGALGSVAEGATSMQRLSSAISNIKSSSDQTARIVKTIDEIAFQTNMLALNAAVEAARAGDAGRGFAVVAEEVRSLAIRSAEAAKTTALLIEESVQNTASGVSLNEEVTGRLGEIEREVSKVAAVIDEIAKAGAAQSEGVTQINRAVTELNDVTQQVAANAEESASASEELASQSEALRAMLNTFRIGESTGHDLDVFPAATHVDATATTSRRRVRQRINV